jgi:hypothetical protein
VKKETATPRTPARDSPFPRPDLAQNHSKYGATAPIKAKTPSALSRSEGPDDEPVESAGFFTTSNPFQPVKKTPPMPIPPSNLHPDVPESQMQYGSFIPTPPAHPRPFELPDPAISPQSPLASTRPLNPQSNSVTVPQHAYEAGETVSPHRRHPFTPREGGVRRTLQRVFSVSSPFVTKTLSPQVDYDMIARESIQAKERIFFKWMDKELDKIDSFYQLKEDEAGHRLNILREQLHEFRNRRLEEVYFRRRGDQLGSINFRGSRSNDQPTKNDDRSRPNSRDHLPGWLDPLERVIGDAKSMVTRRSIGPNTKALQAMHRSPEQRTNNQSNLGPGPAGDNGRDYVRRPHYEHEIPYRSAKRKLKLALQEFYRGMELLKSYSLLNRTAFRKINKKYDKAINAHPPLRFMAEKVNSATFVKSTVLDEYMHAVEDLYARYFERGNHKLATGKLRSGHSRPADQSASAFRNGVLIGTGAVFAVQGAIYGAALLHHEDATIRLQTSYLLQIYGGYFLALYLFSLFCFNCSIWTRNKINYQFVFEFDPRHNLDWRQLSEFPSFLVLLFGGFLWLNFSRYGIPTMFIYYPVILIGLTIIIIFIPAPVIFHRSRRWFVYSHVSSLISNAYFPKLTELVALAFGRFIPRRIQRFLPRRYVLLFDIPYERPCQPNLDRPEKFQS